MHGASGRATASHSPDLGHYYLCEEQERGIRVYLHPRIVDRLQVEAAKGLSRAERHATEIAGILLGQVQAGPNLTVLVENFQALTAPADEQAWTHALAECQSVTAPNRVVGFYRSQSAEYVALSENDVARIHKHFTDPSSVFLLIKPFGNGSCVAGLFFWDDGRIEPDFPAVEIPFGATAEPLSRTRAIGAEGLAAVSEPRRPVANPTPLVAPAAASPIATHAPTPVPTPIITASPRRIGTPRLPSEPTRSFLRNGAILVLLAALAGALAPWAMRRLASSNEARPPATPLTSALGLQVERKPDHLLLSWNRNAPEVTMGRHAVLLIRDGQQQKEFEIDPGQLRTGRVFYAPASADVQFRLEVFVSEARSVAESIRVLVPDALGGGSAVAARASAGRSQQGGSRVAPPPEALAKPPQRGVPLFDAEEPQRDRAIPAVTEPIKPRPFEHVPALLKAEETPSLASPPEIRMAQSGRPALQSELPGAAPPVINPPVASAPIVSAPPATPPAAKPPVAVPRETPVPSVLQSAPVASRKSSAVDFVAARIVRRAAPAITPGARSVILGLSGENVVQVRVLITTGGRVGGATLVRDKGSPNPVLAQAALEAAKKFEFEPARSNDHAVPSEMVLNFRFVR